MNYKGIQEMLCIVERCRNRFYIDITQLSGAKSGSGEMCTRKNVETHLHARQNTFNQCVGIHRVSRFYIDSNHDSKSCVCMVHTGVPEAMGKNGDVSNQGGGHKAHRQKGGSSLHAQVAQAWARRLFRHVIQEPQ